MVGWVRYRVCAAGRVVGAELLVVGLDQLSYFGNDDCQLIFGTALRHWHTAEGQVGLVERLGIELYFRRNFSRPTNARATMAIFVRRIGI